MGKKIGLAALAVLVAVCAFIATRPADFKIERSTVVHTAPGYPYALVSDFSKWPQWSPWAQRDPAQKTQISSPSTGSGATYAWQGNSDVGEGKMTLTDTQPNERVVIRLEFLKPMAATNTAAFVLRPSGSGTEVVWTMTGQNGFVGKAFTLFMNMDQMVGADFEKGLAGIKAGAEKDARQAAEVQQAAAPVTPPVPQPGGDNP